MYGTHGPYACWVPGGEHQSEKVIGERLRECGTRDQIVLSTKGAHPKLESMDVPRLSMAEIQADLDSSLRRLGVEQIDLYWLHRDSPGGENQVRRIFELDAIAGGGSPFSCGTHGHSRLCRKSKHVEPGEARRLASRSDVGFHR
jgi:aryl-alcohol dehydrogenase-like predicted oxidoreductase